MALPADHNWGVVPSTKQRPVNHGEDQHVREVWGQERPAHTCKQVDKGLYDRRHLGVRIDGDKSSKCVTMNMKFRNTKNTKMMV